ncbi:MAG: ferritin-like domain-containing protein [Acidobacteriaceae bacterium]
MALFSANLDSLRELYTDQLQHLYSMETQLTEALPKMADAATDPQLKQAFNNHLQETREHETQLKGILGKTEQSVDPRKSKAMATLITEGEDIIKDVEDAAVRDAGLILAAQRVEHYEMASYGTVRNFARILGDDQAAQILDEILQEEGHADHLLTEISNSANTRAKRAA